MVCDVAVTSQSQFVLESFGDKGVISQVSENDIMDWARVAKDHQGAAFLD
jgi:hypothetical protein